MIAVFGASGFLGSAIANSAAESGLEMHAVVRKTSKTNRINPESGAEIISLEEASWEEYISQNHPETVISAMWSGVAPSYREDYSTQFKNVNQTLFLANICKKNRVANFIAFGSQAEVPESADKIMEIEYEYFGNSYSQAKRKLRYELQLLFENADTRFCWARTFSIYGPGDSPKALIPSIYRAASTNTTFHLQEPGRRWSALHVDDFVSAVRSIIWKSGIKGVINIGNPNSCSIQELAHEAEHILKVKFPDWEGICYEHHVELEGRIPSTVKLAQQGWSPRVTLQIGIESTFKWLSTNYPELKE